jgi:hypothetical protein
MTVITRTIRISLPLVVSLAAALPASAQIDFSGEWSQRMHEEREHRQGGVRLGDYLGLPMNDAGRLKADSWDASLLSLPEFQTMPHPSTYGFRGPSNMRIQKIIDPVTQEPIAFTMYGTFRAQLRTIWLDGRDHPSAYAPHTWQGFSTGVWEGDMLTITTTHIKTGWLYRNGVAHSENAVMWEHWIRNGDVLTFVNIVDDPAYLEEPLIRTTDWVLQPGQNLGPQRSDTVDEVVPQPKGYVPHYLPGMNPFLAEEANRFGIPLEAARGGKDTTYPEYQIRLRQLMLDANIDRDSIRPGGRPNGR